MQNIAFNVFNDTPILGQLSIRIPYSLLILPQTFFKKAKTLSCDETGLQKTKGTMGRGNPKHAMQEGCIILSDLEVDAVICYC